MEASIPGRVSTKSCKGVLYHSRLQIFISVKPRTPYGERGVLVSRNLRGPNYNMACEHRLIKSVFSPDRPARIHHVECNAQCLHSEAPQRHMSVYTGRQKLWMRGFRVRSIVLQSLCCKSEYCSEPVTYTVFCGRVNSRINL